EGGRWHKGEENCGGGKGGRGKSGFLVGGRVEKITPEFVQRLARRLTIGRGQHGKFISPPLEWPRMKLHKSWSARWLRTPLWPRLAISLTLLCVPNTVLAHDICSGLRDRNGHLCCE